MNNYCKKIILPFELPTIDFTSYKKIPRNHQICSTKLIGEQFSSWLASAANAQIQWCEMFYLAPGADHSIHCDGKELNDKVKINFVVGGTGSKMKWYQAVSTEKIIEKNSSANTTYLAIDPIDTVLVHEERLSGLYIVNVGMFHNVYNALEDRFCLSMAISDIDTDQRLTYSELLNRLYN